MQPVLHLHLRLAGGSGQGLVGQVEQLPLVGFAGLEVLDAAVGHQQQHRQAPAMARQCRGAHPAVGALDHQPQHQPQQQRQAQVRVGQAAAGGVADKLRVHQVVQVGEVGHAPHGAYQLGADQGQQGPDQQHRQRQPPGPAVQEYGQQAGAGQVRQIAQRVGPAQGQARAHGQQQQQAEQGAQGCKRVL